MSARALIGLEVAMSRFTSSSLVGLYNIPVTGAIIAAWCGKATAYEEKINGNKNFLMTPEEAKAFLQECPEIKKMHKKNIRIKQEELEKQIEQDEIAIEQLKEVIAHKRARPAHWISAD